MNQNAHPSNQIPAGIGGWSWPRLFRHLGIGPSAASMMALPSLHRLGPIAPPPPKGGQE